MARLTSEAEKSSQCFISLTLIGEATNKRIHGEVWWHNSISKVLFVYFPQVHCVALETQDIVRIVPRSLFMSCFLYLLSSCPELDLLRWRCLDPSWPAPYPVLILLQIQLR